MTVQEMNEKRERLLAEASALLNKAEGEGRDLTSEEDERFGQLHKEADALYSLAERKVQQEQRERRELENQERRRLERERAIRQESPENRARLHEQAFTRWLRGGMESLTSEQRSIMLQHQSAVDDGMRAELRALGTGSGAAGAYTIPEGFVQKIDTAMQRYNAMLRAAASGTISTLRTTSGADLPYPTSDDTSNEGELLAEGAAASAQDVSFGAVVFGAYTYSSKIVKVQLQLLQDSAFNLDQFLADKLGERLGRITCDHFTTGDGSAKPRGITVAATDYGTNWDISDGDPDYDALVDLQHSVDPDYRANGTWMFHDDLLKALRKLKSASDEIPLWNAGIAGAEPPTVLGRPYIINQKMPGPGTATNRACVFGDLSKYVIRRVRDMQMLRLVERYAEYLQVGFLAFLRCDADLVDAGTNPVKFAKMQT